jgi:hypothetical protein
MLIPHDRSDLRLGSFRRCWVAGYRLRASSSTATFGLLAGLGCFLGGKGRWVMFSVGLGAGRAGKTPLVASAHLRDHDLLTQPVLAVCGQALRRVGPWHDYPRTRHQ